MWTFGGSGSTATHTFATAGTHTIGVTVIDNCGRSATAEWTVTVSENLAGQFMFQFQIPGTAVTCTLVGMYNPHADELAGDWRVGGIMFGTWRVRR